MVTMYVGNNSRRLLDEEFVCVQWHAAFGYALLCKIGHKGDLALVVFYHQTYYDGQGGYPKDQPPCPKNMKPIVDALTVADSLDAATDNIGRCYTAAKPLEKLIEELRAQKGSRYAPAVVELFDDPDFCTEFRRKLYVSRQSVYLEVYRETTKRAKKGSRERGCLLCCQNQKISSRKKYPGRSISHPARRECHRHAAPQWRC